MKLIIGGATGFVGKEILRQALCNAVITSIVTIGRRPVSSEDLDERFKAKLTDIVLEDLTQYSDSVLKQLADADACIWTIAVAFTPSKTTPADILKRVCYDSTMAGVKAMAENNTSGKPLRFIYFSGMAVSRDPDYVHPFVPPEMVPYCKLRGSVEADLVAYATKSPTTVEICAVRPGLIIGERNPEGGREAPPHIPTVRLEECVAAVLKQAVEEIELDPIGNTELGIIGQQAMEKYLLV